MLVLICLFMFFFFKQKTAYEMRISDWSSDVCSSDLVVISERWLPRECVARWLTIDRDTLAESGGLALYLGAPPHAVAARRPGDEHPWRRPPQVSGNDEAVPTAALER